MRVLRCEPYRKQGWLRFTFTRNLGYLFRYFYLKKAR